MNRLFPIVEELYLGANKLMFNIGEDANGLGGATILKAHQSFYELNAKYRLLLKDSSLVLDMYDVLLFSLDDVEEAYSRFLFQNPIVTSNTVGTLKHLKRAIADFTRKNNLEVIYLYDHDDDEDPQTYNSKDRSLNEPLNLICDAISDFLDEYPELDNKSVGKPIPIALSRGTYLKPSVKEVEVVEEIKSLLKPVLHGHFDNESLTLIYKSLFELLFQGTNPVSQDLELPEKTIPREIYCYAFHLVKAHQKSRSTMVGKHLVIARFLKETFSKSFLDMSIVSIGKLISSGYGSDPINIPGKQDKETPEVYYDYLKKMAETA